jgi:hypothetical protein
MNLSRLKKSTLVQLCLELDIDARGTIQVLKERLVETRHHWDMKYVRTKCHKNAATDLYSDTEQVSQVHLNSFSGWLNLLQTKLDEELPLDERLRHYFDRGLTTTQVMGLVKCLWSTGGEE